MFASVDKWPRIYEILTDSVPQPLEAREETDDVLAQYIDASSVALARCTISWAPTDRTP